MAPVQHRSQLVRGQAGDHPGSHPRLPRSACLHATKSGNYVIPKIDVKKSKWLFVSVYDVLGCNPHPLFPETFLYNTQPRQGYEELIGRVVVEHVRSRASYIWLKSDIKLPILQIREQKLTVGEFPGYNSVRISHATLRVITQQVEPTWHSALKTIKGVYIITDTSTAKHYVGKASGEVGIWQRWCSYADNGHGGNEELKKLLSKKRSRTHEQLPVFDFGNC